MEFRTTGHIIEAELFGEVAKEGRVEFGDWQRLRRETRQSALQIVKETQGTNDPTDPEKPFANDLHASVAQVVTPDDYSKLRLFTAIGSALDIKEGIDAFIELDKEEGTISVTLDVTANPEKESHKADVIIHVPADGIDSTVDKEEYDAVLEQACQDVLTLLQGQKGAVTYVKR